METETKCLKSISPESQRRGQSKRYQKGQTAKDKFKNLHVFARYRKGWLKCLATGSEFISSDPTALQIQ